MRKIDLIIIHGSFTPPIMDIGAEEIRRWHTSPDPGDPSKPWSDIGYHYVIRRSGLWERGRPVERAGAHAKGVNSNSLGVCLVGGRAQSRHEWDCNYSRRQWRSLEVGVAQLCERHRIELVRGHRDVANRECPGFDVEAWWGR